MGTLLSFGYSETELAHHYGITTAKVKKQLAMLRTELEQQRNT